MERRCEGNRIKKKTEWLEKGREKQVKEVEKDEKEEAECFILKVGIF